jgi:hypothetical protein
MGVNLIHQCEVCCGKDNQEYEQDNIPIVLKKTTTENQSKRTKKILISSSTSSSPTANILLLTNSVSISERTDISLSYDNSQIKIYKSEIICLLNNLTNSQLYEKIINGERLHNILEPLACYNNNILYDLLLSLLNKITDIFKENFFEEWNVISLYRNFVKIFQELNEKNILDDIKLNIEEDSRLKYNLMDIMGSCVELFHFFKYKILNDQEPYNKCYWEQYKDCINYMQQKINEIRNGIININLSLGDNKLKIIE